MEGSDSDSLRAIQELLNRAYGRPREQMGIEVKRPETLEELDNLTLEEALALLAQLRHDSEH